MSLMIYALPYLYSNKLTKYIIICIVASLAHSSALICLIFPIIYNIRKFKIFIVIFTIFNIITSYGIIFLSRFTSGYMWYLNNLGEYHGGEKMMIFMILFSSVLLILSYKAKYIKALRISYICVFGSIIPIYFGGHLGGRIAYYFFLNFCFLIPLIVNNNIRKKLVVSAICSIYFLFIVYTDLQNPIKSSLTPYQTIFSVDLMHPRWK